MRFATLLWVLCMSPCIAFATTDSEQCAQFSTVNLGIVMRTSFSGGTLGNKVNRTGRFGDFHPVIAACKAALDAAPSDHDLRLQYARALIAQTEFADAASVLMPLVEAKQPTAVRLLAAVTTNGWLGVKPEEAEALCLQAVKLGDPVAPLMRATWLLANDEPEVAYKPWFFRAAKTGFPTAEFYLYSLNVLGKLHGLDKAEGLSLKDAARKKVPMAMLRLADLMRSGDGLPADPERATELEKEVRQIQPEAGLDFLVYYWEFS